MLSSRVLKSHLKRLTRFIWTVESRGDDLVLKDDKEEFRYPHVWLRDNCQCDKCFHKTANSRIIEIEHFKFNSHPVEAAISDDGLNINWNDHHKSRYSLSWLIERQFTQSTSDGRLTSYRPQQKLWTATEFHNVLRRYNYRDILNSDEVLLQWLESLAVEGVAMVEGAKTETGQLYPLADRVAFLKRTYYGETYTVRAKPGTSNVAYLAGPLQLHSDLPYYHYMPGINMLHCITQGQGFGGESLLADGLAICEWLRETHPQHYWILSTVNVDWVDIVEEEGKQYHTIHKAPVICEDNLGRIERINWSQPQRDSHFNVPIDHVTPWYRAVEVFSQKLYNSDYKVSYRMCPGEILTFDNIRVLHGRNHYKGDRHLEGGYIDWDYVYSKIRVLRNHVKPS